MFGGGCGFTSETGSPVRGWAAHTTLVAEAPRTRSFRFHGVGFKILVHGLGFKFGGIKCRIMEGSGAWGLWFRANGFKTLNPKS